MEKGRDPIFKELDRLIIENKIHKKRGRHPGSRSFFAALDRGEAEKMRVRMQSQRRNGVDARAAALKGWKTRRKAEVA